MAARDRGAGAGDRRADQVSPFEIRAYWFTSSTSFANPVVTVARSLTNTFAGIGRNDVPGFLAAQAAATCAAVLLFGWFSRRPGGTDHATDTDGNGCGVICSAVADGLPVE